MTKSDGKTPQKRLNYCGLVESIARLHMRTQVGAAAAVNQFLTLRNWLIGACIVEFEQRGSDRARYGERLLSCLSEDLAKRGIRGCSQDRLEWMRRFYVVYPQIRQTLSDESLIRVTLSRISPDAPEAKVHRIGVELPDVPRRSPLPARRRPSSPERACVRFLRTSPMGQTLDGYFLDCWPAFDRLNRIAQRQLGATPWGPLLDHGVTLVYDAWRHNRETGDVDLLLDLYPRFVRFAEYLLAGRGRDRLLPVEGWGVPAVWIDNCFPRPRHKQCAFNLFTAAILKTALAKTAALAGDPSGQRRWATASDALLAATVRRFWSSERGLFVSNVPWEDEEGAVRTDDRSLATALLFDQCPAGGAGFLIDKAFPIQSTVDGRTNWLTRWWKECEGYTGYVCWPFPCEVAQVPSEIDTIEVRAEVQRAHEDRDGSGLLQQREGCGITDKEISGGS